MFENNNTTKTSITFFNGFDAKKSTIVIAFFGGFVAKKVMATMSSPIFMVVLL
jgi:hypothetical protein